MTIGRGVAVARGIDAQSYFPPLPVSLFSNFGALSLFPVWPRPDKTAERAFAREFIADSAILAD